MTRSLASWAALALVLQMTTPADAAVECGLIRNYDTRRACFAERDRRPSDCGLIRDGDARRMCRLRAGERSSR